MRRIILAVVAFLATALSAQGQVSLWNRPAAGQAPAAAAGRSTSAAATAPSTEAAAPTAPAHGDPPGDPPRARESAYAGASAVAGLTAPSASIRRQSVNIAHDVQARDFKVHDILYIVIAISAQATTAEQTNLDKKADKQNLAINEYLRLSRKGTKISLQGDRPSNLGLDMQGERKSQDQGTNNRSDTLRTRIAAEVTDVKPNGNLVIEARQRFSKQGERTTITLCGIIRPEDILPDNVIYSYNVADADIRYESSGPITDASKSGWLTKIFNKIWPF